jgi:hypothetical protein
MARRAKTPINERDIQGHDALRAFHSLLEPLAQIPVHGNRRFTMQQYVSLLLSYFFNPVLTSLRGLQQATGLDNVQRWTDVKPGQFYLMDRGYIDYTLCQAIHDAQSFFLVRLKDCSTYEVLQDHPVSEQDRLAGDLLSLMYRYRWQVELFFRWFKCILGCTHWLSQTRSGLTLQVYVALLASLLIRLWTGRKPTKRTFEMISLYLQGWASQANLNQHLQNLKPTV